MKIAVPLFKERVAPHFGSASKILLIETDGTKIDREVLRDVGESSPVEMARLLLELKVGSLICGGIQNFYKDWLTEKGVRVVDNQRGAARKIVENFLKYKRVPG